MNFIDVLRNLRQGDAVTEFERELTAAAEHAVRTGKPGKLQITLEVRLSESGEVPLLEIHDGSKLSLTKPGRPATLMFKGKDGALSRRDPRQADFFEGPKTSPKEPS